MNTLFVIGLVAMRILVPLFFILLAVRLCSGAMAGRHLGARGILERRFATGEIDEAEYRARRDALES